jgi:hypothetical protein
MAISLEWHKGLRDNEAAFEPAARFTHALARAVLLEGLPAAVVLIPAILYGVRWVSTRQLKIIPSRVLEAKYSFPSLFGGPSRCRVYGLRNNTQPWHCWRKFTTR